MLVLLFGWKCKRDIFVKKSYSNDLLQLQALGLSPDQLKERSVDFIDIAYDDVNPKHYKEEEVICWDDVFFSLQ